MQVCNHCLKECTAKDNKNKDSIQTAVLTRCNNSKPNTLISNVSMQKPFTLTQNNTE